MKIIIAEKEEAGRRIAEILLRDFDETSTKGVTIFEKGETCIIPARGHIVNYTIKGLRGVKHLSQLPIMNLAWRIDRGNKERLKVFSNYLQEAETIIVATDWDREGEVIGYNLVKYCAGIDKPSEVLRAYYSALREEDISRAFNNIVPINEALLSQGLARNFADLIVGLNLTKALTLIFRKKHDGLGQAISLGRVQSPLLGYLKNRVGVDINEEFSSFKYDTNSVQYYIDLGEAQYPISLKEKPQNNEVEVIDITEEEKEEEQAESLYNTDDIIQVTKLDPVLTMELMEQLYLKGYLTYPRTTSRYVRDIKFLEEIEDSIKSYKDLPESFSSENTPSHEVEEAHPDAILLTPEGIEAYFNDKMRGREKFLADIVLARIIRSFAPLLEVKSKIVRVEYVVESGNVNRENFSWSNEYSNLEDSIITVTQHKRVLPELKIYPIIPIRDVRESESVDGRYQTNIKVLNDIDLVRWMSMTNIGTEATRQIFPGVLKERNYVDGSNLPTTLGEIVGDIINNDMEINSSLTSMMETKINELRRIDELVGFLSEVGDWTKSFIDKLHNVESPVFTCPRGHEAGLVNRFNKFTGRVVLLLKCEECDKYYGL